MSRTASLTVSKTISRTPRQKKALSKSTAHASSRISAKKLVVKAGPDWARACVYERAKVVAWEGWSDPLQPTLLYPPNLSFVRSLGLKNGQEGGWSDIVHPIDRTKLVTFFSTISPAMLPAQIEYRVLDRKGSVLWLRHTVQQILPVGGRNRVRGFVEEVQAEKEFQLESLRVSEREQNRIGLDLHDDLCQVLAGVSCLMRVFEGRIAAKAPEEIENLKELNQQIIEAMLRTRALTHGLFPGKIQIADIRGALLELATQIKARFKVEIKTHFAGRFKKHSSAQIIQIYRICQEAMSNAIKHGRATEIVVTLEADSQAMDLSIKDNGCGFPEHDHAEPGVGLNIMKYRAALLGGEVGVVNSAPNGVTVSLRYPFETT